MGDLVLKDKFIKPECVKVADFGHMKHCSDIMIQRWLPINASVASWNPKFRLITLATLVVSMVTLWWSAKLVIT